LRAIDVRRVLTFSTVGFAIAAFALSSLGRGVQIDQSLFLLRAQLWLSGWSLYGVVQDVSPPPIYFLNALPVLISQASGWPIILAFNLLTSSFAVLSGILLGAAGAPRYRQLTGAVWTSILLLAAHDYFFGQREYMFVLAWMPYLAGRCGVGTPPRWVLIASGVLLGFLICLKPHFALIVGGVEAWIWLRFRSEARLVPFVAFLASGTAQVLIFLLLFDVETYRRGVEGSTYYSALGLHYGDVVIALVKSNVVWLTLLGCGLALGPVLSRGKLRPFVEATFATVLFGAILMVLQGVSRPYYLIPLYLPMLAMLAMLICRPPSEAEWRVRIVLASRPPGDVAWRRRVSYRGSGILTVVVLLLPLFFMASSETGIGILALKRYALGRQTPLFGEPHGEDPFVAWVRSHVPARDGISVIAPQYGDVFDDPIISMLRLQRVLFSATTGLAFDFSLAETVGDRHAGCEALGVLRRDIIASNSAWVFVRREMPGWASAQSNDPLIHIQRYPVFWNWFSNHYARTDQFDRYTVYRRIAAFSDSDSGAALRCP
jgi:hypothetical protein